MRRVGWARIVGLFSPGHEGRFARPERVQARAARFFRWQKTELGTVFSSCSRLGSSLPIFDDLPIFLPADRLTSESGWKRPPLGGAEGATAPETLRQKDRSDLQASLKSGRDRRPTHRRSKHELF